MNTLIAILLYLHILQPEPSTTHASYIYNLEATHHEQVDAVENDKAQMQAVHTEWMKDAAKIVVVNDFEQE